MKENLETYVNAKPSLADFTRKSVVGAIYRVGASFTMDAIGVAIATGTLSQFGHDLEPAKLARVAAYVVAINFVDYRFGITDKLDHVAKNTIRYLRRRNQTTTI